MEFKFDAQQEYQIDAIEAVAGLLEGQPRNDLDVTFSLSGLAAVPNILDLSDETLLQNLHAVQEQNKISLDDALQSIEADIETAEGVQHVRFPNFSIEMETGTGKTYVYIRTAFRAFPSVWAEEIYHCRSICCGTRGCAKNLADHRKTPPSTL